MEWNEKWKKRYNIYEMESKMEIVQSCGSSEK